MNDLLNIINLILKLQFYNNSNTTLFLIFLQGFNCHMIALLSLSMSMSKIPEHGPQRHKNLTYEFSAKKYCFCFFQKPPDEKYPVGPWLLGLFIFVVCGSGKHI